jgi:hypothetical protein
MSASGCRIWFSWKYFSRQDETNSCTGSLGPENVLIVSLFNLLKGQSHKNLREKLAQK